MSIIDIPELDFDAQGLEPVRYRVTYRKTKYILCEATADVGEKYENMGLKNARLSTNQDGRPTAIIMEGMANLKRFLLSRCLFTADKDGNLPLDKQGNPDRKFLVSEQTIGGWDNRIIDPLFIKAKEISHLDEFSPKHKNPPETRETIQKKIEELQEKLRIMDEQETNEQNNDGEEIIDPNPTEDITNTSS